MNINSHLWEKFLLEDLFIVDKTGNKLDANKMTSYGNGELIAFVTRSANNNGISKYVDRLDDIDPYPAGCLSVALGGSIGSTFIQETPFYTAQNVAVLIPKEALSIEHKLFIATLIKREAETKFIPFGRELNKYIDTTFTIKLPIKSPGVPDWDFIESYIRRTPNLKDFLLKICPTISEFSLSEIVLSLQNNLSLQRGRTIVPIYQQCWKKYKLSNLFSVEKGVRLTDADKEDGSLPFVGAIDSCNGISSYIKGTPIHSGNVITVNYNGSVGEAFYQPVPFWASDDVNVLYPKDWKLNVYIALFICTVIRNEKYRFSYGRKWNVERMKESEIWLPSDLSGDPDWHFMESYIKSMSAGNILQKIVINS